MLGHGFDEPRSRGVVAKRSAQRLDALRQRFVGDWNPRPYLIEKAVLGDQRPGLANQQRQRVQIARAELDGLPVAPEAAIGGVQAELIEPIAGVRAFQDNLSLCSCLSPAFAPM
jgi:hypothetical protein